MHIEISAGGLNGGMAVSSFQSNMNRYINKTSSIISSFKAVQSRVYNLNGGVGNLSAALSQVSARISTEESRKRGAETVQDRSNDFLDLAVRVDKSVATLVDQNKEKFYQVHPNLRPNVSIDDGRNWYERVWDWLCKTGDKIKDSFVKAKEWIVNIYQKHKKLFDTIFIVIGAALAVLFVVSTFGAGALFLTTVFGISAGVAKVIATVYMVATVISVTISAILNITDIILEIGDSNPTFRKIKSTMNTISGGLLAIASVAFTAGGTGLALAPMISHAGIALNIPVFSTILVTKAAAISTTIAKIAVISTATATVFNSVNIWTDIDSPIYKAVNAMLNWTSGITTLLYGAGNIFNQIKGYQIVAYDGKAVIENKKAFDPDLKVDKQGRTNLERMSIERHGKNHPYNPIGNDGKVIEYHHMTQTDNGPIWELPRDFHKKYYSFLHHNTGQYPSQIDRSAFTKWRYEYLNNRADRLYKLLERKRIK